VYQITLEIQKLEEGPYLGTSPELPGLIVQGASPEEVVELAPDIARDLIEVMLENGDALPPGLHLLTIPTRVPLVVPA
jgi:predicted RNase H-like HicB family nuclease